MPDAFPVAIAMLLSGSRPPSPDDVSVCGGILEAVGRGRPLVARPAREDVKSFRRQSQGSADHGGLLAQNGMSSSMSLSAADDAATASSFFCSSSFRRVGRMRMQSTVLPRSVVVVG